jgi:hypothetical protein
VLRDKYLKRAGCFSGRKDDRELQEGPVILPIYKLAALWVSMVFR